MDETPIGCSCPLASRGGDWVPKVLPAEDIENKKLVGREYGIDGGYNEGM